MSSAVSNLGVNTNTYHPNQDDSGLERLQRQAEESNPHDQGILNLNNSVKSEKDYGPVNLPKNLANEKSEGGFLNQAGKVVEDHPLATLGGVNSAVAGGLITAAALSNPFSAGGLALVAGGTALGGMVGAGVGAAGDAAVKSLGQDPQRDAAAKSLAECLDTPQYGNQGIALSYDEKLKQCAQ